MREWLPPWIALDDAADPTRERRARLEAELRKELAPHHALSGTAARAIARRRSADDVLFALDDGRVALVHLTWARGPEEPPFPGTSVYASLDDWVRDVTVPDHGGHEDEED